MAEDDKPNTADSDPPPDFRRADTPAPGAPLTDEAAASPTGGAPNAADAVRDIWEAIAAGRRAAPCSAFEETAQRLSRQEAAWRQTVASIMAPPVFPPETVALLQRLREPPVIPPAVAKIILETRAVLGGDEIARRIGGSQRALMAELAGCLSPAMIPTAVLHPGHLESEQSRIWRKVAEDHRRIAECLQSNPFANSVKMLVDTSSSLTTWLREQQSLPSFRDIAAPVLPECPPGLDGFARGESILFPITASEPPADLSTAEPGDVPPRPCAYGGLLWRRQPRRRRRTALASGMTEQDLSLVLPAIIGEAQWRMLLEAARIRACPVSALLEEYLQLGMSTPAPESKRRLWAPGAALDLPGKAAVNKNRNRVLVREEGNLFIVSYKDHVLPFANLKGWKILKFLTDSPGKGFSAMELWAAASGVSLQRDRAAAEEILGPLEGEGKEATVLRADGRPLDATDARTIGECKRRLRQIEAELKRIAESGNSRERMRLEDEHSSIKAYIRSTSGGPRAKKVHSKQEENARTNVYKLIKAAREAIPKHASDLSQHLRRHIHTGWSCSYEWTAEND